MTMKSTKIPAPDVVLEDTAPAMRLAHEAIEVGILAAKEYFGKLDQEIDPYLAADLVRYHAALHIDRKSSRIKGLHRQPLANNGLFVHFGSYRIRIRKSDEGEIPDPGPSRTMQAFYQQRLEHWDEVMGEDEPVPVNLLLVWDATRNYVFLSMTLVCPKNGSENRGSAEKYWELTVPHPASMPRSAQPTTEVPPARQSEDDVDDLGLTPKRPPKTGTENADD